MDKRRWFAAHSVDTDIARSFDRERWRQMVVAAVILLVGVIVCALFVYAVDEAYGLGKRDATPPAPAIPPAPTIINVGGGR